MNMIEQNQPNGSLKISQDVIAAIAKHAAEEIDGIESLTASRLPIKAIKDLGRNSINKISTKPVLVSISDDAAVIDVSVIVKAGCKIRIAAEMLQKAVKDAVQTMCGITVSKVNVHVEGICFESENEEVVPVVAEVQDAE